MKKLFLHLTLASTFFQSISPAQGAESISLGYSESLCPEEKQMLALINSKDATFDELFQKVFARKPSSAIIPHLEKRIFQLINTPHINDASKDSYNIGLKNVFLGKDPTVTDDPLHYASLYLHVFFNFSEVILQFKSMTETLPVAVKRAFDILASEERPIDLDYFSSLISSSNLSFFYRHPDVRASFNKLLLRGIETIKICKSEYFSGPNTLKGSLGAYLFDQSELKDKVLEKLYSFFDFNAVTPLVPLYQYQNFIEAFEDDGMGGKNLFLPLIDSYISKHLSHLNYPRLQAMGKNTGHWNLENAFRLMAHGHPFLKTTLDFAECYTDSRSLRHIEGNVNYLGKGTGGMYMPYPQWIGLKSLSNFSNMIHEINHYVMDMQYNNKMNPYAPNDTPRELIIEKAYQNIKSRGFVKGSPINSYLGDKLSLHGTFYNTNEKHREFIVLYAEILANNKFYNYSPESYRDNKALDETEKQLKPLKDYIDDYITPDLRETIDRFQSNSEALRK